MRIRFSTDDVPPHERLTFWRSLWREVVARQVCTYTLPDDPNPATFRAQVDAQVAGPFTLADVQTTADRRVLRTPADVSKDTVLRYSLVRVPATVDYSFALTHARDAHVRLAPGDVMIVPTE